MGEVDACIAVAEYRAFLPEYVCPIFQKEQEIRVLDMYHPLLDNAVANSLDMDAFHRFFVLQVVIIVSVIWNQLATG